MNAMRLSSGSLTSLTSSAPSLRHSAASDLRWRERDHVLVEICTEDVEGVRLSARGGADRAELCDNLVAGGTTPSIGAVESAIFAAAEEVEARRATLGAHWAEHPEAAPFGLRIMIRPRGGSFVFTTDEGRAMMADLRRIAALAREMSEYTRPQRVAGAHAPLPAAVEIGFVVGVLTEEHTIDRGLLRLLVDLADGAPVTFNKAIDSTRDLIEAYGDLGGLGVDYVLTSGGAKTALEGADVLHGMVQAAHDAVASAAPGDLAAAMAWPRVIASGHVRPDNTAEIIARTGVREIHLRCSRDQSYPGVPQRTDIEKVRRAVEAARSVG